MNGAEEDNRRDDSGWTLPMRNRSIASRLSAPLLAAAALLSLAGTPAAAQALSGAARDEPLPRFQDPLCPGVIGLKTDVAEAIVGRVRENAAKLRLPLADPGTCQPNIIASFVADGQEYISRLAKEDGWMFRDMSEAERKALFQAPGKVRTWTRTVVRSRDGLPVSRRDNLAQVPETAMWMAHSRIYVATRRDVLAAMVLFDRDSIEGLSVFQLADYLTMRALAGEALRDLAPSGGTILTLFDQAENRADSLTDHDRAFLETLYSTPANLPAAATLAAVQKRLDENGTLKE